MTWAYQPADRTCYAIAAILALGAVALFTFPLIGHALDLSDTQFGLWAGLAVDNTAETTATGAAYSPHAQDAAYWSTRGGKSVANGTKERAL